MSAYAVYVLFQVKRKCSFFLAMSKGARNNLENFTNWQPITSEKCDFLRKIELFDVILTSQKNRKIYNGKYLKQLHSDDSKRDT